MRAACRVGAIHLRLALVLLVAVIGAAGTAATATCTAATCCLRFLQQHNARRPTTLGFIGSPPTKPFFARPQRRREEVVSMVQSLNLPGILAVAQVVRSPSLLLPHVAVPHIGFLDFQALKDAGVKGIVFDKDNTLTAPYVDTAHEAVAEALETSKRVFGADRLLILSNSAGTGDDPDFVAAARIEKGLGIPVLRHATKKPGDIPEVLDYFRRVAGAETCYRDLCIVGDRLLTDVMWGNGRGMLTVHTQILTDVGDNKVASVVRRVEGRVGRVLGGRGWEAPEHPYVAKYLEGLAKAKAQQEANGKQG